jgi:hypothetical protein
LKKYRLMYILLRSFRGDLLPDAVLKDRAESQHGWYWNRPVLADASAVDTSAEEKWNFSSYYIRRYVASFTKGR